MFEYNHQFCRVSAENYYNTGHKKFVAKSNNLGYLFFQII